MISTEFSYRRAATLDEAIKLLRDSGGEGKFLAGGHSLIPLMKLRLSEPGQLIDIARIPDLKGIREADGRLSIGAGTTHAEVAASQLLGDRAPVITEAAAEIGDPQVRNRGTIGGSLAHADPAADLPAVVIALDAELHLKGPNGWRAVRAEDFFQDLFTVDLAEDELIVAVQFRPVQKAAYAKLHQRASHFAIVGVAAALDVEGGVCRAARVAVTGAGSHAQRLPSVESALTGGPLSAERIAAAAAHADADLADINADLHGSEAYRRAMLPVFARKAIERAAAR